jgi:ABC-type branched-subunit amino acid transport system substrate-binding protein
MKDISIGYLYMEYPMALESDDSLQNQDVAIRMAADEFNSSKWAADHKIRIHIKRYLSGISDIDFIKTAETAIADGALVLVGVPSSREALLVSDVSKKMEVLTVSTAAAHNRVGSESDYLYSAVNSVDSFANEMMHLLKGKAVKNLLIVGNYDNPYSTDFTKQIRESAEKKGYTVSVTEESQHSVISTEHIQQIMSLKHDALVLTTYSYPGVIYINQLIEEGVLSDQLIIVPPAWHFAPQAINELLKYDCDIRCISAWSCEWRDKESQRFMRKYKSVVGSVPSVGDVHAYDAVMMIVKAIKHAKTLNRKGVRDAFADLGNYRGAAGHYYYAGKGGHPEKTIFVLRLKSNKTYGLETVSAQVK